MSLTHRILASAQAPLKRAIAASLAFHAILLLYPGRSPPPPPERPARRIEATLAPRPQPPAEAAPPAIATAEPPPPPQRPMPSPARDKPGARPNLPAPPTAPATRRDEMNAFLRALEEPRRAGPDLMQRALAMARAAGRQQALQDEAGEVLLERLPDSPPVDPVSLEMYLDGLVNKLNRSAAFVKNDPRNRGVKTAAVLVRIDPDGALQSFRVLNAADQQAEIEFIRSVVERAVPFPAFPSDMRRSARSLAMTICILPAHAGGGGFGFARTSEGRRC